jgi:hypothetical protein
VSALVLLLGGLLAASAQSRPSVMAPTHPGSGREEPPGLADTVAALRGADGPDRLLAARDLRRLARRNLRLSNRSGGDELLVQEALVLLEEMDRLVAPTCIGLLQAGAVARPCADVLGVLETADALPALRDALSTAGRLERRRFARAIARIERAQVPG